MSEELKKISVEVSNDCWKKIKIYSVDKEITLQEAVRDILEKAVGTKKFEVNVPTISN